MCGYVVTTAKGERVYRESAKGGGVRISPSSGVIVQKASGKTVLQTRSGGKVVERDVNTGDITVYTLPQQPRQAKEQEIKYEPTLVESLTQPQSVARQTLISVPGGVHDTARQQSYRLQATPEQIARMEAARRPIIKRVSVLPQGSLRASSVFKSSKEEEKQRKIEAVASSVLFGVPGQVLTRTKALEFLTKKGNEFAYKQKYGEYGKQLPSYQREAYGIASLFVSVPKGIITPVVHPVSTLRGLYESIRHPLKTASSFGEELQERPGVAIGEFVGNAIVFEGAGRVLNTIWKTTVLPPIYRRAVKGLQSKNILVRAASRKILPGVSLENVAVSNNILERGWTDKRVVDRFRSELQGIIDNRRVKISGEGIIISSKLSDRFFSIKGGYTVGKQIRGSIRGVSVPSGKGVTSGMKSVSLIREITYKGKINRFIDVSRTMGVIEGDVLSYRQVGGTFDILKKKGGLLIKPRDVGVANIQEAYLQDVLTGKNFWRKTVFTESGSPIVSSVFESKGLSIGVPKRMIKQLGKIYQKNVGMISGKLPEMNIPSSKGYSSGSQYLLKKVFVEALPVSRLLETATREAFTQKVISSQIRNLPEKPTFATSLSQLSKKTILPSFYEETVYAPRIITTSKAISSFIQIPKQVSAIKILQTVFPIQKVSQTKQSLRISKKAHKTALKQEIIQIQNVAQKKALVSLQKQESLLARKTMQKQMTILSGKAFFSSFKISPIKFSIPPLKLNKKKNFKKVKDKRVKKYFKFAYSPDFFSVFVGEFARGKEKMRFTGARTYSGLELRKVLA